MNRRTVLLKGFTLIELMMVVAIIGLLATIAIPKFSNLIRRSKEAGTLANLGSVRSALTLYYSNTEGAYPINLSILEGIYIEKIPTVWTYDHGTLSSPVVE